MWFTEATFLNNSMLSPKNLNVGASGGAGEIHIFVPDQSLNCGGGVGDEIHIFVVDQSLNCGGGGNEVRIFVADQRLSAQVHHDAYVCRFCSSYAYHLLNQLMNLRQSEFVSFSSYVDFYSSLTSLLHHLRTNCLDDP
ncbi:hypothetical protein Hanom_Chr13g01205811 [Helianthus anomalus]